MKLRVCYTCEFYQEHFYKNADGEVGDSMGKGECRKLPPTIIEKSGTSDGYFPGVEENCWCGSFEERKPS